MMKAVISAMQIRKLRKELDCTQEQFGELIGRSWSTVARWESRGGITGRIPATGKKRESMGMLRGIELVVWWMTSAKMPLERRKQFLVETNEKLLSLRPIDVIRIDSRPDGDSWWAMAQVHNLIEQ